MRELENNKIYVQYLGVRKERLLKMIKQDMNKSGTDKARVRDADDDEIYIEPEFDEVQPIE